MGTFYLFVALAFFAASIYVLSRSNDWSRLLACAAAGMTVAIPLVAVLMQVTYPLPRLVAETLGGLGLIVPFLVLFALSKSVANKTKR